MEHKDHNLKSGSIIIADVDRGHRSRLVAQLSREGWTVFEVADLRGLKQLLSRSLPEVLLFDPSVFDEEGEEG